MEDINVKMYVNIILNWSKAFKICEHTKNVENNEDIMKTPPTSFQWTYHKQSNIFIALNFYFRPYLYENERKKKCRRRWWQRNFGAHCKKQQQHPFKFVYLFTVLFDCEFPIASPASLDFCFVANFSSSCSHSFLFVSGRLPVRFNPINQSGKRMS